MPASARPFQCVIVGEGTLPIRCAALLRERGHTVACVVADDPALQAWAREHGITVELPGSDLGERLSQREFDYLFSVVNYRILAPALLALPRRFAVNYHDALLPRYAGLHASSWAILHGEREHGVTWHVMTDVADAGDVLKQRVVAVDPQDSAFSLNGKCYEAAIAAFTELIDELAEGRERRTPQDLARRTYFGRSSRPPAAGVLSWQRPAEAILATRRALDFGTYPNPLGSAKLGVPGGFYLVDDIAADGDAAGAAPGTILARSADALRVATTTGALRITRLLDLDGAARALDLVATEHGLDVGARLPELAPETCARISALDAAIARHEDFWVRRLAEFCPVELPHRRGDDGPAPVTAVSLDWPVPPGLLAADDVSGHLFAVFALYLARTSGARAFDLGFTPRALADELRGLDGLFAGVLPVRVVAEPDVSFARFADAVRAGLAASARHRTHARDLVARRPELRRRLELRRLRDIAVLEVAPDQLDLVPAVAPGGLVLLVAAEPKPGAGVVARLVGDGARFDDATLRRIVAHLQVLLAASLAEPERPLHALPLLPADERAFVLGPAAAPLPAPSRCLHTWFEDQVARSPDAVALRDGDARLTYRDLERRANRLAHLLRARGVGPETIVGLLTERTAAAVVAILAILKAGAAYLPFDPAYPSERIAFMLGDSEARLVITDAAQRSRLPASAPPALCLDALARELADQPDTPPAVDVRPDALAYIIFTSGSTGRPKGVLVSHANVVRLFEATDAWFRFAPTDVWTLFHSLAFDFSVWELWGALLHGGSLVVIPHDTSRNPVEFYRLLAREGVTVLNQTPSAFQALARADAEAPGRLPLRLRLVIFGGEALDPRSLRRWADHHGLDAPRLVNMYGITETTVHVSYRRLERADLERSASVIGRPIPDLRVYVLDAHGQPQPIGVPGEIHVGGAGVARGYLRRPELTAQRFVDDPFGPGKLYRSGDLARILPSGELESLGRIDHQVKIRGFRIELGEVEAALATHSDVREALVLVREDSPGDRRLVAYLVLRRARPDVDLGPELRHHLRDGLPDYMLPAAFVVLPALPLTTNGKVDRAALPAPAATRSPVGQPPRSPTEVRLAQIWSELLRLAPIGAGDDFFALGGHSLHATQVASRLYAELGLEVPIREFFRRPTLAAFAEYLDAVVAARAMQHAEPDAGSDSEVVTW